jgi:diguanylate cyclase (GGDEF)-like protein/PAS domain S-box-containing protein
MLPLGIDQFRSEYDKCLGGMVAFVRVGLTCIRALGPSAWRGVARMARSMTSAADPTDQRRPRPEFEHPPMMPAMSLSIGADGRLISVNEKWLAKFGYARDEVLGKPLTDFMSAKSRESAITQGLPELFRGGRCENLEYQMVGEGGCVIDVLLSAVGEPDRGSVVVITDVTALKETERRLAASEARYRELIEGQSELVSLATPEGELRYVNEAFARLYGRRPHEMAGRSLLEFAPSECRPVVTDALKKIREAGESHESENQVLLLNGERRWIAWSHRAVTDANTASILIHSVGRDIERRVEAENRLKESEARHRFLAEHSTDLILLLGAEDERLYASPVCKRLLGFEPEEMLALRPRECIHPGDIERVLDVLENGTTENSLRYRMRRKDGRYVWVESTGRPIKIAGQGQRRLVVVREIEERMAIEQSLRESEARYRLLADHAADLVFQLDRDLVRRYVSPACREILGYEPEQLVRDGIVIMHPDDAERVRSVLRSLLDSHVARGSVVCRIRHRDGRWIWVETDLRAFTDPQTGAAAGIIGASRDISARKTVEEQLAEANRRLTLLATEDGLTKLANRRAFDDAISRECGRARRDRTSLGLLMIDVDGFKAFNDRYGHPAGDETLRRIAEAITGAISPGAVAARYGGEEFAVILPGADEAAAATIAGQIRSLIARLAIEHGDSSIGVVTASVGVAAISRGDGADLMSLLNCADRALYCAKSRGRDLVVRASSLASGASDPRVAA